MKGLRTMIETIIEHINEKCKSKGVTINKMLIELKLNKSVVDNMKKGRMPSIDKIYKIAEYLNCSIDYLMGRTENPEVNK